MTSQPRLRLLLLAGLSVTSLLISSGCLSIPNVDDHFSKSDPLETVRYFRYAIDASDFDKAYQCMTENTHQQISPLQFKALIRFVDVPELGDIGLRDLIVNSSIDPQSEPVRGENSSRWITLIWEDASQFIEYSLKITLGEDQTWNIDMLSTRGLDLGGPAS
ncbi:MAG: hypothetical protein GWP41_08505 [Planctomycetia bacterium]|jgi:hypothetical protein|nr:hypothetical protein [Planctomycetia bacterium]NCG13359.1 hypothetical protein [Planctomycetia bacterium]NCG55418.1 hypothetical protein [Pseudomonadota bacterium]